ncbi:MAG TPA: hypothetical protein VM008_21415 [Phycisphaerae bacterium]|nr:hypothetical protein [Phycisphaerae bacterium]
MIDLSRAQKIQIGVVATILALAGYMLYRGSRPEPDMTIASWTVRAPLVTNASTKPVMVTVSVFACYDGRLKITEYPPQVRQNALITFDTDFHRTSFTVYRDPLLDIEAISDPYKRVLTFAAYNSIEKITPQSFLARVGLTGDQRKAEKAARDDLVNAIGFIDNGAETGAIQPELYKQVMSVLATFKAKPGDSTKDAAKAELAHKVVALAIQYINELNARKAKAINQYVATMDGVLNSKQKETLAKAKVNMRARRRAPVVAAAY